jgi:uncharacterized OsmC-like protein
MDLLAVEQVAEQKFVFKVRGHTVVSDMASNEGGNDEGPSPTELLVGAIGTCIGMAVARYCQTISCEGEVSVYLTYQLADHPKRVSNIVIDLELPENFPTKRISAIQRVIEACPVHGTLMNPPQIDIEIS